MIILTKREFQKNHWSTFLFLGIILCLFGYKSYGLNSSEILKKSDQWRGVENASFEMLATVMDYKDNALFSEIKMKVWVKNNESTLAYYLEPASDKGKLLLMVNENMWFYQPNLEKPIRISPRQRLLGNVANADIARVNYQKDYTAEFYQDPTNLPKDPILPHDINDYYVLKLTAINDSIAYASIIYWVDKTDFKPMKAIFYTLSGKLLKTAYYTQFAPIGDHLEIKLSEMIIYDAIQKNNYTKIQYTSLKSKLFPDKFFNVTYIKNIR